MMERFQFFCVYCEKLVQGNERSSIFKTGFYKYEFPMGYCTTCKPMYRESSMNSHIIDKSLE